MSVIDVSFTCACTHANVFITFVSKDVLNKVIYVSETR